MYMICYIDIYFLENVLMNFIILFGTAKVRRIKINWVRILIASIIGALCSTIILVASNKIEKKSIQYDKTKLNEKNMAGNMTENITENKSVNKTENKTGNKSGKKSVINKEETICSLIIKIVLSIVMIKVAYNIKFNKGLIKTLIVFYLISFATAGIAMALIYSNAFTIVKFENNPENITRRMPQQSLMKNAIISGSIGFIITFLAFKYNKSKITKNDLICELIIKIGNKKVRLKALIDTGNSLKYSNTNDNVIIVEKNKIFSEDEFKKYIEGGSDENEEKNYKNANEEISNKNANVNKKNENGKVSDINANNTKLRLIPFKSIGKENGVLIGIKPDEVIMIKDEKITKVENVIIGMYEKKIGTKYSAIIGIN